MGEKKPILYVYVCCFVFAVRAIGDISSQQISLILIVRSNDSHWPGSINRFQLVDTESLHNTTCFALRNGLILHN